MSREIGSQLPRPLIRELARKKPHLNAVPLISTDPEGFPHGALLSYFELIFEDSVLYCFLNRSSRSAKYLGSFEKCSLLFVRRDFVYYVKAQVRKVGEYGSEAVFQVEVVSVLEDLPLPEEAEMFLKTGIRFAGSEKEVKRRLVLKERIAKQIQSGRIR